MADEREETIQAGSRAELVALLARHRWLKPLHRPRRVPGSTEWFVRVRARVPSLTPAPPPRRRGRTIAALAAVGLVLLVGVVVLVWLALSWAAAHWAPVIVVLFLLAVTAAAFKRR